MNVNRDVVNDLLPLYLAGEASAGTRALLEEYLRENPDFASEVREQAARSAALLSQGGVLLPPDHEKATLERTRRFNRGRARLLAFCIALTLIPFTAVFEGHHLRWLMLRDSPEQAGVFWSTAASLWIAYFLIGRLRRSRA